jgi:CubicO group peptidase (beta-lactamase class C family)
LRESLFDTLGKLLEAFGELADVIGNLVETVDNGGRGPRTTATKRSGMLIAPEGAWIAQRDYGPYPKMVWRNVATVPHDVEHMYLYITRAADGSLQAFIRNPEQNAGARVGTRTVVISGNALRLERPNSDPIAGTWSPDTNTLTLTNPGLPGAYAFTRAPMITALAPYLDHKPQAQNDGWPTATLASAAIDPTAIAQIVNGIRNTTPAPRAPYIQSLLITRHGKLVLDEYFNGFGPTRPHDVRSAGKSVATLLVGRAIQDTHAFSPQTRIAALLSQYEPLANDSAQKEAITVANLMSMSAGYACDDNADNSPGGEDTMQSQTAQPDWYKFTLDLPMQFAPGTRALYCSAEINLLGAIVSKETGSPLTSYFDQRFARPLQFGAYGMWLMPPPTNAAYMAGGDYFLPRDFLKLGQLFLNNGRWHGKQIIDPKWLADSAAKHSFVEGGGGDYGYGWHLATYTVGGRTVKAINAGGNGGQLMYVFPQLDMVVMITAANYGQYPVWSAFQTQLVPQVLAATH